jgi:hypothetical protein
MINPADLLTLADALVGGAHEREWRGAFHAGRQLLEALNFQVPQGGSAHAYVLLRLSNCGDRVIEQAGRDLRRLQSARNKADYDLTATFPQADAQLWARTADDIVQAISTGLVEPTRAQVTAAIRDYERNALGAVTWQGP